MYMALIALLTGAVVAMNLAYGKAEYFGIGRPQIWMMTIILYTTMTVVVGLSVNRRWDGIFVDERNKISLSRVQLVLWTLLLVSALTSAALSNVSLGTASPLQIEIPASVWALLGLGSLTSVASPIILNQKEANPAPPPGRLKAITENIKRLDNLPSLPTNTGEVVRKAKASDARWMDIFRGDTTDADVVDVSKVQQFAFSLLLVAVYASAIWATLGRAGAITAFPAVDSGFVALLGLSHAAYLAYKAAPKPS